MSRRQEESKGRLGGTLGARLTRLGSCYLGHLDSTRCFFQNNGGSRSLCPWLQNKDAHWSKRVKWTLFSVTGAFSWHTAPMQKGSLSVGIMYTVREQTRV